MISDDKSISLKINGSWNNRDIASLTGVNSGVVIRSATLNKLTDAGKQKLLDLGVTDVVDVRSKNEINKDGADFLPANINLHIVPIDAGDISNFKTALGSNLGESIKAIIMDSKAEGFARTYMIEMYKKIITNPETLKKLGDVLKIIGSAKGTVLIHCTAGKDRTGIITAILLRLAGVDDKTIIKDYLYSNNSIDTLQAHVGATEGRIKFIRSLLEVHPEYLQAVFDEIDHNYASLNGFLHKAGLSDSDVHTIVHKLKH